MSLEFVVYHWNIHICCHRQHEQISRKVPGEGRHWHWPSVLPAQSSLQFNQSYLYLLLSEEQLSENIQIHSPLTSESSLIAVEILPGYFKMSTWCVKLSKQFKKWKMNKLWMNFPSSLLYQPPALYPHCICTELSIVQYQQKPPLFVASGGVYTGSPGASQSDTGHWTHHLSYMPLWSKTASAAGFFNDSAGRGRGRTPEPVCSAEQISRRHVCFGSPCLTIQ